MAELNQRIFLVGMMGAGKSYRARMLADFFDIPWFDTDMLIEKEAGKTIREIFAEPGGEARFRLLEHELLLRSPWPAGAVIACGGGMPCFHDNIELMLEAGLVVWLNPELSLLSERLWKERWHRPMVAASASRDALEEKLKSLLAERQPFYLRADIKIDGNPPQNEFNRVILSALA